MFFREYPCLYCGEDSVAVQTVIERRLCIFDLDVPDPLSLPVYGEHGVDHVPDVPVLGVSVNSDSTKSKRRRRLEAYDMKVKPGMSE